MVGGLLQQWLHWQYSAVELEVWKQEVGGEKLKLNWQHSQEFGKQGGREKLKLNWQHSHEFRKQGDREKLKLNWQHSKEFRKQGAREKLTWNWSQAFPANDGVFIVWGLQMRETTI